MSSHDAARHTRHTRAFVGLALALATNGCHHEVVVADEIQPVTSATSVCSTPTPAPTTLAMLRAYLDGAMLPAEPTSLDHNVMSPDAKYDLGVWGTGQTKDHAFKTEGVFSQICKLHPEMLAYVFVGQNRFAAQVDDKGAFKIAGLPAGTYELDVWNPKLKSAPQTIKVGADGSATAKFSLTR
ncbi:MAG: hypothetical protein NT062_28350 [Proteobacteria bacterium]|nr:hypothetical protein [Pseudomonadota bacterium]